MGPKRAAGAARHRAARGRTRRSGEAGTGRGGRGGRAGPPVTALLSFRFQEPRRAGGAEVPGTVCVGRRAGCERGAGAAGREQRGLGGTGGFARRGLCSLALSCVSFFSFSFFKP